MGRTVFLSVLLGSVALLPLACTATSRPRSAYEVELEPSSSVATPSPNTPPRQVKLRARNEVYAWLQDLEDPKERPEAVLRLVQEFEDVFTVSEGDRSAPEVRAVLDAIVDPLTQLYVEHYSELDDHTRIHLLRLLEGSLDSRAEPALHKALSEFAQHPTGDKQKSDIKWAIRAAGELKLPGLNPAVIAAFEKLEAHTLLGGITYKDYNRAMVKIAAPAWRERLIAMLGREVDPPRTKADRHKIDPYRDQLFWQTTSAQVLGLIGDPAAVEPLMKLLLDPNKLDVGNTALMALIRIGKPSVERAGKLLAGKDPELERYSRTRLQQSTSKQVKGSSPLEIAATVLGSTGLREGLPPLLEVLRSQAPAEDQAIVAKELTKIPATPASKAAFQTAVNQLPLSVRLNNAPARAVLAEASVEFHDPSLVPWLLGSLRQVRGSKEDLQQFRSATLFAALKLVQPDQIQAVRTQIDKLADPAAKQALTLTEELLTRCQREVQCYLAEIQKPNNQTQQRRFAGLKAGVMIGLLGETSARDQLIKALSRIDDPAVRFVAAQAIDHLTPNGSREVVRRLEGIIEANQKSMDRIRIAADHSLKLVVHRLHARSPR